MAIKKGQGEVDRLASSLTSELTSDTAEIAKRIQPEVTRGGEQMQTGAYLDLVARNWSDPQFRQQLLTRVGPQHFLATAQEAIPRARALQAARAPAPSTPTPIGGAPPVLPPPPPLPTAPTGGPSLPAPPPPLPTAPAGGPSLPAPPPMPPLGPPTTGSPAVPPSPASPPAP